MKRLIFFILTVLVSCTVFAQASQPASAASIEKLLEMTETRQAYEATMQEMGKMIDQSIASRIPAEKREKFKQVMAQLDKVLEEEMSWEKMKPLYVQIYTEIFTQQEIDDLIAFYQTPSGQSFIKKQPLVIQRTMALSQEKMGIMMERLPGMMQKIMMKNQQDAASH